MSTAEPAPAGAEAAGQGARVGDLSEEELLAVITPLLPRGPQTPVGTGDDCAVLSFPDSRTAVSTDVLVEGRHFRTDWSTGRDVGARAAAQNLADAAAMGARPSQPTASKARAAVSMMSVRSSGPMRAGQTMATAS